MGGGDALGLHAFKGLSRPAWLLLWGAAGQCGEEGGSRGRHGTCSAAASIIAHGGASRGGGGGGGGGTLLLKGMIFGDEEEGGFVGVFPYRGGSAELMAPRVSWRWKHGWHLCGEISQFSIASGNWQKVVRGVRGGGSWRAYGAACIVEVEARVASLW